ncbi:uncharacterized protein LOC125468326 isoform X2 [Pyrus x bretschneideri]|uniref:uncharacterized protein LOC125468326 isoform X2 n=1 Tax=Pyrus x bretschneideri TaxID=225117 RepID=UPI00202FB46B|nr:uncharacterized protein LOC125468326 isoform X2 [Pyrus x bretschneideri]
MKIGDNDRSSSPCGFQPPVTQHARFQFLIKGDDAKPRISSYSLLCSNHFCRNWLTTVTVNPVRSDIDFSLICLIDIAQIDISPLAPCEIHVDYMD